MLTAHEQSTVEPVRLPGPVASAGHDSSTFFLLPGESGDPRQFRRLAQCLSSAYAVSILRASECGSGDTADSIEGAAQRAARAILLADPSAPCLVGGIREGGVIAFEAALQLTRLGRSVRLVLFDTPLPGGRFTPLLDTLRSFKRHLARYFPAKAGLPDRGAGFAILHFLPEESENALDSHSRLGWERRTSAATDIVYLPGNHESLLVEANLPRVGRALRQWNGALP